MSEEQKPLQGKEDAATVAKLAELQDTVDEMFRQLETLTDLLKKGASNAGK